MNTHSPRPRGHREILLPQWAVSLIWAVYLLGILVLLPWAASRLGPRFGWRETSPGTWNLLGLAPVVTGLAGYSWCLAAHFKGHLGSVPAALSPPHLVIAGPYRYSRNPMYLSALLAWLGWSVYYGSPTVMAGLIVIWSLLALRVIPLEERQLEATFGTEYLEYKRSVSRWIGRS